MFTFYNFKRIYLQQYLDEFMWRHNSGLDRNELFTKTLESIAKAYPLSTKYKIK